MEWKVPYVNYKIAYQNMKEEIHSVLDNVMSKGDLILRKDVEEFENNFAKFQGAKYGVGVNSCTDAMRMCLRALGIGKGHDVIVPGHTFLATIDAIVDAGANPILVDVSFDYNLEFNLIEENITPNTSVIMPVHLNGRCCHMERIMDIANKYALYVVEDAAQGIGASFDGKKAGTFDIAGCFSFFPAKILGSYGDGGMILTDDKKFADALKAMRDYGRVKGKEEVVMYGQNSRLDNIHAAILNMKMQYLDRWIDRRRRLAREYHNNLCKVKSIVLPMRPVDTGNYYDSYQNYVIMAEDRDKLVDFLRSKRVEVLVHWAVPLHKHKALGLDKFKLPNTEYISDHVVSLPMYPELSQAQVEYVCDRVKEFYAN